MSCKHAFIFSSISEHINAAACLSSGIYLRYEFSLYTFISHLAYAVRLSESYPKIVRPLMQKRRSSSRIPGLRRSQQISQAPLSPLKSASKRSCALCAKHLLLSYTVSVSGVLWQFTLKDFRGECSSPSVCSRRFQSVLLVQ
jgi:hypothetical protein